MACSLYVPPVGVLTSIRSDPYEPPHENLRTNQRYSTYLGDQPYSFPKCDVADDVPGEIIEPLHHVNPSIVVGQRVNFVSEGFDYGVNKRSQAMQRPDGKRV